MIFTVLRRYFLLAIALQIVVVSAHAMDPLKACVKYMIGGPAEFTDTVQITGEQEYPLPYVLKNLGYAAWVPSVWDRVSVSNSDAKLVLADGVKAQDAAEWLKTPRGIPSKDILSLGEGYSGLAAYLTGEGHAAVGIDKSYPRACPTHGDATCLTDWDNASVDLVVSHALLTSLSHDDRVATLKESYRVLREGGEFRHSLLVRNAIPTDNPEVWATEAKRLVEEALPAGEYQIAIFLDRVSFRYTNGTRQVRTDELLGHHNLSYAELKPNARGLRDTATNVLVVVRKEKPAAEPVAAARPWYDLFGWFTK
ncbi:class I SAM-dependent methyltransferase [bacterium]|nr:class I SAM-dependent methyltransferase [bacterium]